MIGDVCGINPFYPVYEVVCGKETLFLSGIVNAILKVYSEINC